MINTTMAPLISFGVLTESVGICRSAEPLKDICLAGTMRPHLAVTGQHSYTYATGDYRSAIPTSVKLA